MKRAALAVLILLFVFQIGLFGQTAPAQAPPQVTAPATPPAPGTNPLFDYMRPINYDGLTLRIVLINDRTADVLFQTPQKQAMKARSHQQTVLLVQGTPTKEVDLTTTFTITQGTDTMNGTTTSRQGFVAGKAPAGQRVEAIVEFPKKIDVSQPFTIKNGTGEVQFVLTPEAIKALAPPPAAP